MTVKAEIKYPAWLENLPPKKRERARKRWLVNLAALHYSPRNSVSDLSRGLGMHAGSLNTILCRDTRLSAAICVGIEKLVGRQVMPREILDPEIFRIPS